jgi:23S rRNA pseudouridine1911/1915/1917 synthase
VNDRLLVLQFDPRAPQRLDKFLADSLPEFSRTRLQALIKDGFVTVNGQPAAKAGEVLDEEATIQVRVPPPQSTDLTPEAIPLDVVFENPDVLVVNKPAGMVVHPSPGHDSGTLVHAALAHAPQMGGVGGALSWQPTQRPGVVHRLDKQTSGLILLAKNDLAHRWLQDQFRARATHKIYIALVDGRPPTPTGHIEAAIGRNTSHRQLMGITTPEKGREAVSEYRTLEAFAAHTLLEVHPITGRTHQIRLHLKFIGCPVTGDTVYGKHTPTLALGRHFLHAARLTIQLPNEKTPRTFEAPLPTELVNVLNILRGVRQDLEHTTRNT